MYKKIFSAILLGAFTLASTSTFVSCKDYDDDIKDLQSQITSNDNDIAALQEAKTALETKIADLKTQLENADAKLAETIQQAKEDLAQAIKDGDNATAKAAQKALEEAQAKLEKAIADGDQATAEAAQKALEAAQKALEDAIKAGDDATLAAAKQAVADAEAKLQKAIEDGDAATIATARKELADAKSELAESIKASLAEAKAYTDKAVGEEKTRAMAAEAALEARIETAEQAIKDINKLLDTKVDKTVFDEEVKKIYAKIEAVEKDLGDALKRIKAVEDGLANEIIARKAVEEDLKQQKNALEKLTARVKTIEDDYLKAADKKELNDKIDKAVKDLEKKIKDNADAIDALTKRVKAIEDDYLTSADKKELQDQITKNADNIKLLQDDMEKVFKSITAIQNEIAVLNVFVAGQLRSLVFVPQTYYWGVEAAKLTSLKYVYYNIFAGNNWAVASADKAEPVGYDKNERYKQKEGSTHMPFIVEYHMNPSTADAPDALKVLDDDYDYESDGYLSTRTSAAKMSVVEYKKNGGDLQVEFSFADPEKIEAVLPNSKITTFAVEASYKTGKNDTTITSDYAAVIKTTVDKLVLSHTQYGYTFPGSLYKDSKARNSFTKVGNSCTFDFKNDYDNQHSTLNCELTNKVDFHLIPTVYEAMAQEAQDTCDYDKTLDLSKLVETHYMDANKNHKVLSASDLKKFNLEYRFELTATFEGGNKTSEAAHAGIKDGIFRPQIPQKDGKAYSWEAFDALGESLANVRAQSLGRQPVVRFTLVDTKNNNRILDYGYIKIRISETTYAGEVAGEKENVTIEYTGDPIVYNSECEYKPAYGLTTTWYQIEYDVLRMLQISKEEFEKYYTGQLVECNSGEDAQQYKDVKTNTSAVATIIDHAKEVGTVTENYDANNPETSTFTWTIDGEYIVNELYGKASHAPFTTAIRYASVDKTKYPDLYIILKTGAITINRSSGVFLKEDGTDRIKEYWFKDNGNGAADFGLAEIHAQTISPEDPQAGDIADVLDDRFSDVFAGNAITLASVTDVTPAKDFAANKRLYDFVFSEKNNGKVFTGIIKNATGAGYRTDTWTLRVSNDGKALEAQRRGTVTWEVVATIDGQYCDATAIKEQKVSYDHETEAAKALLNYAAHNKLADDVLKAIIALKVKTNVCEHELDLTNKEFNVRFLRPINVIGKDAELEDAKDEVQKVDLKELVALSDWREYQFATHENYWQYYGIKAIKVINAEAGTLDDQASGNLNSYIYTTMSKAGGPANKLEDKITQSTISNQVLFRLIEGDGQESEYGYILYENLSSAVQTFKVSVPLEVEYYWGSVFTEAVITVKNTHENVKRQ